MTLVQITTVGLALVASAWTLGAEPAQHGPNHDQAPANHIATSTTAATQDRFQRAMREAMARMMHDMHAGQPTDDPDREFLAMMIPHHQGAIEMAQLLLEHGRDPLTRQLAEHILATQTIEIEAMRGRLESLARGTSGEYPATSGTRGEP